MTMPSRPFAEVPDKPSLYDDTRRRATARRARRTALTAALSVAVIALGAGFLVRGASTSHVEPLVGSKASTDAQLVAMADCVDPCQVLSRVELTDGRTFAVLGTFLSLFAPDAPTQYRATEFVLAHGTERLDSLPTERFSVAYDVRTDRTGNVLVPLGNQAPGEFWFLPLSTRGDRLTLLIGSQKEPRIRFGDGFADVDHDGRFELVTMQSTPRCDTCMDATSWQWDGSTYVPHRCTHSTMQTTDVAAPSCGPVETPQLAIPTSQQPNQWWSGIQGCASCTEAFSVALPGGRTFSILNGGPGGELFKVALRKGDELLDVLPRQGFADGFATTAPVTDASGRVLLHVGGGATASWALPFSTNGDHLGVIQGTLEAPDLKGDNNVEFRDVDGDGILEILLGNHDATSGRIRSSTTTYSWNGTRYARTSCTGELC